MAQKAGLKKNEIISVKICAVIIAGGSGTRLWPLSRTMYPKQFLSLNQEATMLQLTVERLADLNIDEIIVICNEDHRFLAAEQLKNCNVNHQIILEPVGRDTAPAVGISALYAGEESLLLVLPADHIVEDQLEFTKSVFSGVELAKQDKLVTFGVVPQDSNTGYGYIKKGIGFDQGYKVDAFIEKPSKIIAEEYVKSGDYLWNSGMFLFKASKFLAELKKFRSDIYDCCIKSSLANERDLDFLRIDKECFSSCPSQSIDYAVMEKTKDSIVIPMSAGWNDLGSWSSLWDVAGKNADGNFVQGDVITLNSKNSFIKSDKILVSTIGVDNLVVIASKDVVLVSHKDHVEDVKLIAGQLKKLKRTELDFHREVYRPWGKYECIDSGEGYQVKRITVNSGAKLSLQMHHYRAEHWIVVSGVARVTRDHEVFDLSVNESTYIPVGATHSLENYGLKVLELIEVQSGSYLGEDDIVRFEDIYGRDIKKKK